MLDLAMFERAASDRLGTSVCLESVTLTQSDRGRSALGRVLARLGLPASTQALEFPHLRVSLTHAAGLAVACGSMERSRGVGVDYERARRIPRGAARLFLSPAELSRLGPYVDDEGHLLRLWTVKEALFKADARNAGRWIGGYAVDDALAWTGTGTSPAGGRFRRATFPFADGVLSIAVGDDA